MSKTYEQILGFDQLTIDQQELFQRVHQKHLQALGTEARKFYTIDQIREVRWDHEDETVNVYFEDDWWHYTDDEKWY
jgi:hypothetical protein